MTPARSSSRRRSEMTLGLALGRPFFRSVKRLGPSSSSRTTSSAQRSPTRSSAWAIAQPSPYVRVVATLVKIAGSPEAEDADTPTGLFDSFQHLSCPESLRAEAS